MDTSRKKQISVARLGAGQSGIVVQFAGGHGLSQRLQALGVRPGKKITKVSSMFGRGPVTVQIDNTQIAIGYGMADKIIVDIDSR